MKFKQLSMTIATLCVAGSAVAAPAAGPIAAPKLGVVYDAGGKFACDFVAAWNKVMNLDRFDLLAGNNVERAATG